MTQAIDINPIIVEKLRILSPEKQQQVLDFVEFLQSKTPKVEFKHPDGTPMSVLEAAGGLIGCVDGGPGDLSTNKEYLKGRLGE